MTGSGIAQNAPQLPPMSCVAAALRATTERLAAELANPQAAASEWSEFEWRTARATDPSLQQGDWGGLSQGRRIWRAVRTCTPRPRPLHNVREALAQTP